MRSPRPSTSTTAASLSNALRSVERLNFEAFFAPLYAGAGTGVVRPEVHGEESGEEQAAMASHRWALASGEEMESESSESDRRGMTMVLSLWGWGGRVWKEVRLPLYDEEEEEECERRSGGEGGGDAEEARRCEWEETKASTARFPLSCGKNQLK